ncbi:MAG: 2-amino-4-hydroxy-6-hydroxymethyldihydropteridine diphosphokinase [Nitrososphaerota archaeon]|jgi:dihydroneopterin aldolase/2-amino-4-hydroxy-6-hydroxymethyldihydropteridine diphosphokinase|nr:2-amino-4-hydroxy-6-hydroxymethyldihydropteridine diphosphokinase [Nitrososphaerota archaeon]
MDKILIAGIKTCGKHGVLAFEREYPQIFTVDMELWVDNSKSYLSDDLQDTVNYAGVYDIVKSVIEAQSFMLIERLSYVIIEKVFVYDSRIQRIKIRTMKNKAPLVGQFDYAGVEIEKTRDTVLIQDAGTKVSITPDVSTCTGAEAKPDAGYKAVLSLGSNIGDRKQNIQKALEMLTTSAGINILNKSKLYETEPVGYVDQEKFYNAAILVETTLNPFELRIKTKDIENNLGRKKTFRWGPRLIDIDIIAYEGCMINTNGLTLPHKEYMQRAFVLKPISDMPDAVAVAGLNMALIEKMTCCADDYHGLKYLGPL